MESREGYSRPSFRSFSVTRLARAFRKGDMVDIYTVSSYDLAEQRGENKIKSVIQRYGNSKVIYWPLLH